jgi:CRISPR-associated protein Cas1
LKKLLNTLYITTQGTWLSREGETAVVTVDHEVRQKLPIHNIGSIVCFGLINATPAFLGFCAERGVAVSFFTEYGKYLMRMDAPVRGNVLLRRQQYRFADDQNESAKIARSVLVGKVYNSRIVLQRAAREDNALNPEIIQNTVDTLAGSLKELGKTVSLDTMRGIEGDAARHYFDVFDHLIISQKEDFTFIDRNRRPPMDNVNAMLSFAYSLLAHEVASALEGVGLDPAVGFLHRDRPGRPSLALDLMEEFRSWFADRIVLTLINRKEVAGNQFTKSESGAIEMNDDARKKLLIAWQKRKQDELVHPFLGEKVAIGILPHIQAQLLARYIRGDMDAYPPFVWR